MNVTLADAYVEACRALGEATVREGLLNREIERLTALLDAAQSQPAAAKSKPA